MYACLANSTVTNVLAALACSFAITWALGPRHSLNFTAASSSQSEAGTLLLARNTGYSKIVTGSAFETNFASSGPQVPTPILAIGALLMVRRISRGKSQASPSALHAAGTKTTATKGEIEELRARLAEKRASELEVQLAGMRNKLQAAETRVSSAAITAKKDAEAFVSNETSELRAKLEAQEKLTSELKTKIAEARDTPKIVEGTAPLQGAELAVEKEVDELRTKLMAQEKRAAELETEAAAAKKMADELRSKATSKEADATSLVADVKKEADDLRTQIAQREKEINGLLRSNLADKDKEIETLRATLTGAQADAASVEISVSQEADELRKELATQEKRAAELETEIAVLRSQSTAKAAGETGASPSSQAQAIIESLEAELKKTKQKLLQTEDQLKMTQLLLKHSRKKVADLEARVVEIEGRGVLRKVARALNPKKN